MFSLLRKSKTQIIPLIRQIPIRKYNTTYFYTKSHETIKFIEEDKIKIGISNYAKKELGEIVFLDVEPLDEYKKNDTLITIESIKSVNEIVSLFDGAITKHNDELIESPDKINELDEQLLWILEFKLKNPPPTENMDELLNEKNYLEYIKTL